MKNILMRLPGDSLGKIDNKKKINNVNITCPKKKVSDCDVLFNGEYLVASLACGNVEEGAIRNVNYNVYVDGELWETL